MGGKINLKYIKFPILASHVRGIVDRAEYGSDDWVAVQRFFELLRAFHIVNKKNQIKRNDYATLADVKDMIRAATGNRDRID